MARFLVVLFLGAVVSAPAVWIVARTVAHVYGVTAP